MSTSTWWRYSLSARAARAADQAQERAEQKAAEPEDDHDSEYRLAERQDQGKADMLLGLGAEDADHEENRHHGEVLEEEDREAGAADRARQLAPLDQELHDDRGRGQREAGAQHDRGGRAVAELPGDQADDGARDQHLERAEAEDQAAHLPQARERQLEPDHEEEEDDAELGQTPDAVEIVDHHIGERLDPVGDEAEAEGADQGADQEIAEHRADPEAVEHRHDDPGGDEEDDHLAQMRDLDMVLQGQLPGARIGRVSRGG
jgi:hypothetical protein